MPHSIWRVSEPTLTTRRPLRVCTGRFISYCVPSTIDMPGPADQTLLDMDSLLLADGIDPDVDEAIAALAAAQSVSQLESASTCDGGFLRWATGLVDLIAGLDPSAAPNWCVARRALLSMMTKSGGRGGRDCDPAALFDVIELANMVDVCGPGNRAAPFARDLVGRFYRKSVTQGSSFRDVRMTPSHFDEVVSLSTLHLPRSPHRTTTIPPAYRVFAVLFWLAQGGKQRVVARTVYVAESTFAKHCAPVIHAMLSGLPKPEWPGCAERQEIARDFARLMGGNAVGWRGLYADDIFLFSQRLLVCYFDVASAGRTEETRVGPLMGRTVR